MHVKPHDLDPFSFVFGAAFAAFGLYFLLGGRSAADIGAAWIWPVPILLVGLTAVMYAVRRMRPEDGAGTPNGEDRHPASDAVVDPTPFVHEPSED